MFITNITTFTKPVICYCSLTLLFIHASPVFSQACKGVTYGTKTIYTPQQKTYTTPPAGYKPVYINHVGRHGARHLTKDVDASFAYKILMRADKENALTKAGSKLKSMMLSLQKVEAINVNSISARGEEEQYDIAARMKMNYKNIFNDGSTCFNVAITNKIRTRQSATAFLKGLQLNAIKNCDTSSHIETESLRFFDIAPAYLNYEENGIWKKDLEKVKAANGYENICVLFVQPFFSAKFTNQLTQADKEKFLDDIYGFATILNSIKAEVHDVGLSDKDVDFISLFTCIQLQKLELISSVEDFLLKAPGTNDNGIQVIIAIPLLVDFLLKADQYVAAPKENLDLRFTHAEAIAPFAALLNFAGASEASKDILHYRQVWKSENVIPLSANIQWVFYRNSSNNFRVKFLLNEKEVHINGLDQKQFPYYSWTSVRSFYMNKLKALGVNLHDDMHAFLLHAK